jgi:hypothetical protein
MSRLFRCLAGVLFLVSLVAARCGTSGSNAGVVTPQADGLLETALNHFREAESFRFSIRIAHDWVFEEGQYRWNYLGEGAFRAPDSYRFTTVGSADSGGTVEIEGGTVSAWDARGEVARPTTTWGAPGYGASPYSVIAYLRGLEQANSLGEDTIDGQAMERYSFSPQRNEVAAIDGAHAAIADKINRVEGELWVDASDKWPARVSVTVRYVSVSGNEETVQTTLDFTGYGEPVDL